MKIVIVGMGYVGLSNALLLSQMNDVIGIDTDFDKIQKLKNKQSPLEDDLIKDYLKHKSKNLTFDTDLKSSLIDADLVIVSTPTDYDPLKNYYNVDSVISVINIVKKFNIPILIKSTIPIGFVSDSKAKLNYDQIYFSPEFLREGRALYDNLYPSRIIVGDKSEFGKKISELFKSAALKKDCQIILTNPDEAEAIKLFANNYLAMRISFFNELDSYTLNNNLSAKDIINGICSDPRIGDSYNNPSFGYGGYCLPKDTKQLLATFVNTPQNLFTAIVESNETRKNFLVSLIMKLKPKAVGIYRLVMKHGSDNFRSSSIQDIIYKLKSKNINIFIFEPTLESDFFGEFPVVKSLAELNKMTDLILANRGNPELDMFSSKVYTRDIFNEN